MYGNQNRNMFFIGTIPRGIGENFRVDVAVFFEKFNQLRFVVLKLLFFKFRM